MAKKPEILKKRLLEFLSIKNKQRQSFKTTKLSLSRKLAELAGVTLALASNITVREGGLATKD